MGSAYPQIHTFMGVMPGLKRSPPRSSAGSEHPGAVLGL